LLFQDFEDFSGH